MSRSYPSELRSDAKTNLEVVIETLDVRPPSRILEPVSFGDEVARAWFGVMTQACCRNKGDPPTWFRRRYDWGPAEWPVTWSDAIKTSVSDCGLFAALALEAWTVLGESAALVQVVELYNESSCRHWQARWVSRERPPDWLFAPYVYHECVAVLQAPACNVKIRLWDPTNACWMNERASAGYGAVRAVRLFGNPGSPSSVSWNRQSVPVDRWIVLEERHRKT